MTRQPASTAAGLFRPGHNCWRVARARRAACLIDGESYFSVLRQAILEARHSIFILGWDINSRFALLREPPADGMPVELRDLLNAVARNRPELHIYIVAWDYAALLALDREWLPGYRFNWRTHRRVNFQLEEAVTGGSHHQKVVVIDDALAFCGGLDLTFGRWDSPAHAPDDSRRRDVENGPVPRPYHDVQMMVSGPCAAALGDLARQRWQDTTGERLDRCAGSDEPWPQGVTAEFHDIDVAISLTLPANSHAQTRHVEQLYLDMIAAAARHIYIENQYLTADRIGQALGDSLQQARGPEIIIVTPLTTNGWLSQFTMDVMRSRMLRTLRKLDRHGRLRVYYPHMPGTGVAINVHAKVMVVDDDILRIGSSNLNNRSMGLDTECDLALVAHDDGSRAAIQGVRNRLLAEHLDVTEDEVAAQQRQQDSLIAVIETLQGRARSLRKLQAPVPEELEQNIPAKALIDPEAPVDSRQLRDLLVPRAVQHATASRILLGSLALLVILSMAALWRWSPLADLVDLPTLTRQIAAVRNNMLAPLAAVAMVMAGSLVALPVTLLMVATMLVFGGLMGGLYAFTGALLGAVAAYAAGQFLGAATIRRMAGARLNHISKRLAHRGIITVVIVRLIPIAPFVVVNLVAGVSHIRLRDFAIGSAIGMLPGTIALGLITEGVIQASRQPDIYSVLLVALILALLAAVGLALRHWLVSQERSPS